MFSCYRRAEADDPGAYALAVAVTLADYPVDVISRVTDPRIGLPSRSTFLPSIAEVRRACEHEMAPLVRSELDARVREERRRAIEEDERLREDRRSRPTYEELQAKYGPNWGIRNPDHAGRPRWWRTADEMREQIGDAFDEIPNAPPRTGTFSRLGAPSFDRDEQ